jgi:NADH-quinone oxidoreductase subunit L
MVFVVFGGEPSPFVSEHFHALKRDVVGLSLAIPVAILAVLSVVGGWIQFAGVWTPISDWLHPVAEPLVEATGTQELVSSVLAVGLGIAGAVIAWLIYGARRVSAPGAGAARQLLEHKFYFDELYDLAFYRPAVLLARLWGRAIEKPLILGSVSGVAFGAREVGDRVSDAQTGYLRTYVLALAASLAALAIVFVAVRS